MVIFVMKNLKQPSKIPLVEILRKLKEGKYIIPDFQRDFDWQASDIMELIKSIFSNYYIGNLLLWKNISNNKELLGCNDIWGYNDAKCADTEYIVLDGQQRLTSLYYAFFKPEKTLKAKTNVCRFFINIKELIHENYEEAFFYKWFPNELARLDNEDHQMENDIFPLYIISKDNFNYYREEWLRKYREKNPEFGKLFRDILTSVVDSYNVPFIELEENIELNRVCDIFEKINSRGKKLDTFDLLNSLLNQHDIRLRTEMWKTVESDLERILDDSSKIYILQTMSILKQSYCSPKYLYYLVPNSKKLIQENGQRRETVLINGREEFLSLWEDAVNSLKYGANCLYDCSSSGYGITKKSFLPYHSIVHIFSALNKYICKNKIDSAINRAKIRKWYFASIFAENYSSSVDSTASKDFEDIKRWFEDNSKTPDVVKYFNEELFKVSDRLDKLDKPTTAIYKVILNLIVICGARDFFTGQSPTLNTLEDHHIIPKSKAKELGINNINTILNRTLISDSTNRSILDNKPCEYIKSIIAKCGSRQKAIEIMCSHLINEKAFSILEKEDFSNSDYADFINERKSEILKFIKVNIFELY